MFKRHLVIAVACLLITAMFSPAEAIRNTPKKANKTQHTLVQGVDRCTAPNTEAGGFVTIPACDPVVPSDPGCVFGVKGSGKILLKSKSGDVSINAKLSNLESTCDGEALCLSLSFRNSYGMCPSGGDCSTVPVEDLTLAGACCTLSKGKCKIKTTFNTDLSNAVLPGIASEIIIGEIGLSRPAGPGLFGTVPFRGGLLVH